MAPEGPTHFKEIETFHEDHSEEARKMLAAALYEAHRDHYHATETMKEVIYNRRTRDE